ncbi:hypothetical protein BDV93DRAFT_612355 [Ceratobasidium sp. AG-I]|nr:hypothetical protein BDV93DRAFT_612355 [Ceratobasidium sp. AG-I]
MANFTPNDATLSSLDSSASQLGQTQITLDVRNARCFPSATINNLPAELLCYIFMHAKVHCIHDALFERSVAKFRSEDKSPSLLSPDNISPVCLYWRKLLNNTPALWTHVDLGIGQLQDANFAFHGQRSLERAKRLPLHIHVESVRKGGDSHTVVNLLAPYASQMASLDLSGNVLTAESILLALFSTPYRGSVKHLHLHDEDYERLRELQDGLFSSGLLDEFLLSLPSLSLRGPSLDYNSPAFRDLTNLAIIFSDMCPTPYQLTQALAACPALLSLTLTSLSLAPGSPPANGVNLPSLQALDLRCMYFDDVVTITSCILPKQGLSMSFTLNIHDDSYAHDLSPLTPFLKRFHARRLFLNADFESEGLELRTALYSFGDPLPSLEELALDCDLLEESCPEGSLLTERFPLLHTLHILGENVPFKLSTLDGAHVIRPRS